MNAGTNMKQDDKIFYHHLAVKLRDDFVQAGIHENGGNISAVKDESALWCKILEQFPKLQIGKLFTSLSAENITQLINKGRQADPLYKPVNLLAYYRILCTEETNPDELIKVLLGFEWVELAYIQGRRNSPSVYMNAGNDLLAQQYLDAAPAGIDAKYAWQKKGGKGKGQIKFIDIEQGWQSDHELINIKTLPLTGISQKKFSSHGTAVFGIIMMKENNTVGTGIVPEATGYVISQWRPDGSPNEADAILAAISYLRYGDIILLESQSFHPDSGNKLWPVEIQEATFQVIRLATAIGIIVIEAAGNGDLYTATGNDLDLFTIDGKQVLWPGSNHFKDSGAIVVAAASQHSPHTRIMGSNYGSRVNCYASGEPAGGYEKKINGTSGASAIIAGAVIAMQSICETEYGIRIGAKQMREIVSNESYATTSAYGHAVDKIGVMPDLKKIIDNYLTGSSVISRETCI
ncbi:MAG: S8 family serine peptidase [Bacteroidota bacterium]